MFLLWWLLGHFGKQLEAISRTNLVNTASNVALAKTITRLQINVLDIGNDTNKNAKAIETFREAIAEMEKIENTLTLLLQEKK